MNDALHDKFLIPLFSDVKNPGHVSDFLLYIYTYMTFMNNHKIYHNTFEVHIQFRYFHVQKNVTVNNFFVLLQYIFLTQIWFGE